MDLQRLFDDKYITRETLDWIRPLWEQELALVAEVREAAAARDSLFANNEHGSDDDEEETENDESGLMISSVFIRDLGGVTLSFWMDDHSAGHGNRVWHASIAMCIYLKRMLLPSWTSRISSQESSCNFRCLELGAGTALPSLFLGHLFANEMEASSVNRKTKPLIHITDGKQYRNIRQILLSLSKQPAQVLLSSTFRVSPHNWGEGLGNNGDSDSCFFQREFVHPYHLIIVSDCIYNPTYHDELLQSIAATLKLPNEETGEDGGCAVISFSLHGNTPDHDIWDFLQVKIPSKRHPVHEHWRLQAWSRNADSKNGESSACDGRNGWNMEQKMKDLGLWTANINPKRWLSYIYEVRWVPTT
mmetsp:Transcript_1545/g.2674  ORF Transcript_1545/g.2674 Transcript_1545/m.2674 type:complete len:360 (+) Transcript_1545:85-1164(+)